MINSANQQAISDFCKNFCNQNNLLYKGINDRLVKVLKDRRTTGAKKAEELKPKMKFPYSELAVEIALGIMANDDNRIVCDENHPPASPTDIIEQKVPSSRIQDHLAT